MSDRTSADILSDLLRFINVSQNNHGMCLDCQQKSGHTSYCKLYLLIDEAEKFLANQEELNKNSTYDVPVPSLSPHLQPELDCELLDPAFILEPTFLRKMKMLIRVEKVIPQGSVSIGVGKDESDNEIKFAGDWRMMQNVQLAIEDGEEPIVYIED